MSNVHNAKKWSVESAINGGLMRMVARQLDYTPAADDMGAICKVYISDLKNYGLSDDDAPRILQALEYLACRTNRFPTPKMIVDALPSKRMDGLKNNKIKNNKNTLTLTHSQIERNKEKIAEMLGNITSL